MGIDRDAYKFILEKGMLTKKFVKKPKQIQRPPANIPTCSHQVSVMNIPRKISTNEIYAGKHWKNRFELKTFYHLAISAEITKGNFKKLETFPVFIRYDFFFKNNPLDSTNCSYMLKMIEDSLVHNEILPDDSLQYVAGFSCYSHNGPADTVKISISPV